MGYLSWSTCAGVTAGLFISFDVFWFLRLAATRISALFKKPICVKAGDEGVIYSICTTTDLDYFCHMNNGRYMRELDFGRFDFYFRSGLNHYLSKHRDVYVVQHASMIRYRRSLTFLMPFRIHTKLIWFDQRSLYFEQRFVSCRDNFVRAVAICKNTAVNCNVHQMLKDAYGLENQPECPEVLKSFIEANEQSSSDLRKEIGVAGGNIAKNASFLSLPSKRD